MRSYLAYFCFHSPIYDTSLKKSIPDLKLDLLLRLLSEYMWDFKQKNKNYNYSNIITYWKDFYGFK
jgi:hypothetical protein